MDQQTKQALKHDQFVDTTNHGLEWASENRRSVIVTSAIVLAAILIVVGGVLIYNSRATRPRSPSERPCRPTRRPSRRPGKPVPPGVKTYPSVAERAKAANDSFMGVADKYGMTPDGKTARYFAGLTYMEARAKRLRREHAEAGGGRLERGSRRTGKALARPTLPSDGPRSPSHRSL